MVPPTSLKRPQLGGRDYPAGSAPTHRCGLCGRLRVKEQASWSLHLKPCVFLKQVRRFSPWNGRQVCSSAEDRTGPDVHSEEDLAGVEQEGPA